VHYIVDIVENIKGSMGFRLLHEHNVWPQPVKCDGFDQLVMFVFIPFSIFDTAIDCGK
jgi:hypothetical protein